MQPRYQFTFLGADLKHPIYQGILVMSIIIVLMFFARFVLKLQEKEFYIGASGLLLFVIINPIISIFRRRWITYFLKSFVIFLLMLIITYGLAGFLAAKAFESADVFQIIYPALIVFYIMVTILAFIFRQALSLFQQ